MARQIKHRNTSTIWLYDFTQFETFSQDRDRILFLSMMDINLIWNAIQNISLLQTRVYTDAEQQLYTMVDDIQFETFQGWVSDLRNHLGEYLVTNEILAQMLVQLEAIANKACCPSAGTGQGSRGSGGTQVPINTYSEGTSGGTPPPGFSTNTAWKSNMCNAAQDIINNLGSDLQGLSGLSYAGQSPSGLAALLIGFLLTPVPFDDIVGLAGYLIFTGYNYSLLAEMSAQVSANNDDLLCILYNSDNAGSAEGDFFDRLQEIATETFTSGSDAEWVMGAIDWFITNDAFNKLFEPSTTVSQDADCSACGGDATWILWIPSGQSGEWGTIELDVNTLTGSSEIGDDCNRLNIRFAAGSAEPSQLAHIDVISTTGATHTTGYDFYRPTGESTLIACPSNDCQNTEGEDVYEYALCSNTAFSLFIQWSIP